MIWGRHEEREVAVVCLATQSEGCVEVTDMRVNTSQSLTLLRFYSCFNGILYIPHFFITIPNRFFRFFTPNGNAADVSD